MGSRGMPIFKFLLHKKPDDAQQMSLVIFVAAIDNNDLCIKLKEIKFKNLRADSIFDFYMNRKDIEYFYPLL
jgi:hypothetical protein